MARVLVAWVEAEEGFGGVISGKSSAVHLPTMVESDADDRYLPMTGICAVGSKDD